MGLNNPVPRNMAAEVRKAARILASFTKPNQLISYDEVIPPHVLRNAKGFAIITVLKAGFLFSGRAGSGVIVARLPDGTWSPPSAIITGGAGVGGQIGAEITDFIFVLNTADAVKTFAKAGSITLGGNISLAAGPLGRNAEAAGAASTGGATAIFSYAKTKGLFAGVSLEGSVLIERREANRKYYGANCNAKAILGGRVPPPRSVEPLFRVLDSKAFSNQYMDDFNSSIYDDIPDFDSTTSRNRSSRARYDDDSDDDYGLRAGMAQTASMRKYEGESRGERSDRYESDRSDRNAVYDPNYESGSRYRSQQRSQGRYGSDYNSDYNSTGNSRSRRYSDDSTPSRAASPAANAPSNTSGNVAIALYSFAGEEASDLPFRKGDVITIVEKSNSTDDWWTGRINGKQGIFPANYVELR